MVQALGKGLEGVELTTRSSGFILTRTQISLIIVIDIPTVIRVVWLWFFLLSARRWVLQVVTEQLCKVTQGTRPGLGNHFSVRGDLIGRAERWVYRDGRRLVGEVDHQLWSRQYSYVDG